MSQDTQNRLIWCFKWIKWCYKTSRLNAGKRGKKMESKENSKCICIKTIWPSMTVKTSIYMYTDWFSFICARLFLNIGCWLIMTNHLFRISRSSNFLTLRKRNSILRLFLFHRRLNLMSPGFVISYKFGLKTSWLLHWTRVEVEAVSGTIQAQSCPHTLSVDPFQAKITMCPPRARNFNGKRPLC